MPEYVKMADAVRTVLEKPDMTPDEKDGVVRRLKALPAADVVAVVRCRECQHYNAGFECLIEGYGIERPADWFCADGERKDGGQGE